MARTSEAYRGYLIRKYPYSEGYWIEQSGITIINFMASPEDARGVIDILLQEPGTERS